MKKPTSQQSNLNTSEPSSFRDDRGRILWREGELIRTIGFAAQKSFDKLISSGLYDELVKLHYLIPHREVTTEPGHYKTIAPDLIPFISYPYEWSFSQLKDAALLTLEIQKCALARGLSLRDASAYNVQFQNGKPIFIDTLSFDIYTPGEPWIAYRQFCQHFLSPLALAAYCDIDLLRLSQLYIDGVPLQLAAQLLPTKHKLGPLGVHIALHARLSRDHSDSAASRAKAKSAQVSRQGSAGIIDSLRRATNSLKLKSQRSTWSNYYEDTNYSKTAFSKKEELVQGLVTQIKPRRVIDLGGNDGTFSRLATNATQLVLSCDVDPRAVEYNYLKTKHSEIKNLLPLVIDLTNPSPAIGWANTERASFLARAKSDLGLALALIHHLAIGANIPLPMIAEQFSQLASQLIIEFVPKDDSQVQRLLANREDIFDDYNKTGFEIAFSQYYKLIKKYPITGSQRSLYHYEVRQ